MTTDTSGRDWATIRKDTRRGREDDYQKAGT